jgi:hypothetical protein
MLNIQPNKIRLRQSEIDRADNGWTVVVRPQSGGGVMVATIHIPSNKTWEISIVKNGEVQTEIRLQLRMMHKCGWDLNMADRSRHRTGEKMTRRLTNN